MANDQNEEELLRSAALQNAKSILLARQRVEGELIEAKDALQHEAAKLAEALARMRATLESTTDAILVTDGAGRITDFNGKYVTMWRIPPHILDTRDHPTVLEEIARRFAQPASFLARVQDIYRDAPVESYDLLELADGRAIERFSSVQVIHGQNAGRVWSFRDTTERKQSEEALRQQREWFQVTLSSIGDAVITTDIEARVTFLNPIAENMTGWTSREAVGQPLDRVFNIVNELTRKPAANPVTTVLRDGSIVALANHTALIAKDGSETAIEDSAAPIRDASGKVSGAVMVFHDVTSRRRSEEQLLASEQRFRTIFNQAAVGIAVAGLDGRFLEVNQKISDFLGYSTEELKSLGFFHITHPDDMQKTENEVRRLIVGEASEYVLEKRYLTKSNETVWSLTTVKLLKNAQGEPQRFIGIVEDITARKFAEAERRRAEAELRARERELTLIYQNASDIIFYLAAESDTNFRFLSVNGAFLTATGLEQHQVVGKRVHEVIPEPSLNLVIGNYQTAIRERRTVRWEETSTYPSGKKVGAVSITPLFDPDGKCINLIGTVHDITEQKRAENALREETGVLELLNKTGTSIAAKLDLQSLVQTVTDAATQLSGAQFGAFFYNVTNPQGESLLLYTLSGAPREMFEKFGLPRNTEVFNPTFRAQGIVRSADITQDPRYGKMAPHHGMPKGHPPVRSYLAVPVVSRSGEAIGGLFFGHFAPNIFTERSERLILGIAAQAATAIDNARLYEAAQREIAERLRVEQELRESETRLRLSIEATALGTWVYEPVTGAVSLDERCRELFGLPKNVTADFATFLAVVHPGDRERTESTLRAALNAENPRGYDIEYRTTGLGTIKFTRWIRGTGKAFFDTTGKPTRLIGAVLDITDVVKARETMAERRAELERLVAERTNSLQEAVGQMEEFSYSVSHDLRAPLRAIQGYAQALLEDYSHGIDAEGRAYLQRIVTAGIRMDRLTHDVLRYSKIARTPIQLETISLERLMSETLQQYASEHLSRGTINVVPPLMPVIGHEPSLVQAVSNLLGNALKFIPAGKSPSIRVWTDMIGNDVRLYIQDNGIGIPAEQQGRIWGMFERVHPKENFEGTGIGLAIVRKAVERMGGQVGVESESGVGSKFWIQLRAAPR